MTHEESNDVVRLVIIDRSNSETLSSKAVSRSSIVGASVISDFFCHVPIASYLPLHLFGQLPPERDSGESRSVDLFQSRTRFFPLLNS